MATKQHFVVYLPEMFKPKQEKKVVYTHVQAVEALQHYCAYQDRCHKEARQKLRELGYYGEPAEAVIADLITEKYLDELRFAQSFARGKFKIKRWGRMKITRELKQRDLSAYCIRKALKEIEEPDYIDVLCSDIEKHNAQELRRARYSDWDRRGKVADYMIKRGFEASLVWDMIREMEI